MKKILIFALIASLVLCLSASALAGRHERRSVRNARNAGCPYAADGYCDYAQGECPSRYCLNGGKSPSGGQGRCGGCRGR